MTRLERMHLIYLRFIKSQKTYEEELIKRYKFFNPNEMFALVNTFPTHFCCSTSKTINDEIKPSFLKIMEPYFLDDVQSFLSTYNIQLTERQLISLSRALHMSNVFYWFRNNMSLFIPQTEIHTLLTAYGKFLETSKI